MRCPYCNQNNDKVVDTRYVEEKLVIRRRRSCCACGKKFTTYERIEETRIRVIKRDGSRLPYDRKKLQQGLERACWKRQISDIQISTLIAQVEQDIEAAFESEVQSQFIGERVMHYLGEIDQVAYVRFASVYRHFNDADDFAQELQRMRQNPDILCLSSEYAPKKKVSRCPKPKHNRYKEQSAEGEKHTPPLPVEAEQ
jgi:transcriptional repressor NrdR